MVYTVVRAESHVEIFETGWFVHPVHKEKPDISRRSYLATLNVTFNYDNCATVQLGGRSISTPSTDDPDIVCFPSSSGIYY